MTRIAVLLLAAAFPAIALAGSATAQVITPNVPSTPQPTSSDASAPVEQVDRVVELRQGGLPPGVGREGIRIVQPGALLFASFDTNHDGHISDAEIDAGAAASFAVADKNGDGSISAFELSDWAKLVGDADDVLSNPMQFDTDLDHAITQTEFVDGFHRLAKTLMKPGQGELLYSDLVRNLERRPGAEDQTSENGAPQQGRGRGRHASAN